MSAVFFTFLDGAFRYDCATCGQACCRGKGVALDARRELVPLLTRAPKLAPFLEPLPGGYVRLPDATDGCWFLRSDGFCGYEQEHGRAAKFTTCRLFPYNRVFRAGAVRVVDVNSVVCPIEDAHGTGRGVTHEELRRELEELGDGPLTGNSAELPPGARELRWHALEEAILAQSAQHLGDADYVTFAAWQEAQARRHLGSRDGENPEPALRALLSTWRALYGVEPDEAQAAAERAASRALVLLTPSLRFNALFRRGAGPYKAAVQPLPRQLLATWFLMAQAARVTGRAQGLRAVTELHQAQAALRGLLARLDERASLQGALAAPDVPHLAEPLAALSRTLARAGAQRTPLGEQLLRAGGSLPPASRALLVPVLLRAGDALRLGDP